MKVLALLTVFGFSASLPALANWVEETPAIYTEEAVIDMMNLAYDTGLAEGSKDVKCLLPPGPKVKRGWKI